MGGGRFQPMELYTVNVTRMFDNCICPPGNTYVPQMWFSLPLSLRLIADDRRYAPLLPSTPRVNPPLLPELAIEPQSRVRLLDSGLALSGERLGVWLGWGGVMDGDQASACGGKFEERDGPRDLGGAGVGG